MVDHFDPDDGLPPELREPVNELRRSREPSAEWRDRVLRATSAPSPGSIHARGWLAAAAGLAGMLIGGASVYIAMRQEPAPVVATAASTNPGEVRVRFTYQAPGASTVTVVGDFNQWNPTAIPLRRSADGKTWEIEIPLTPGRYAYAFYVDGALARDPDAPQVRDNDFGTANSVVMVRGS
jgi:hypothetical protein